MRRCPRITAVACCVPLLIALGSTPAGAAVGGYVALGDSYSSGTGTRSYLDDGTSCQRSVYAYPSLVAATTSRPFSFRACAGATTADVLQLQLGALRRSTRYVSITVGGNDAGFAAVLTECGKPAWASSCPTAVERARTTITSRLPERLADLYRAIHHAAPNARVVVAGYPHVFNGHDCNAFTWFSRTEEARLNDTADLLNDQLRAAAADAHFVFRSPATVFTGHAVCDPAAWLNGLSRPTSESFHPNRLGHLSGYAPLVGPALGAPNLRVSALTEQRALAGAPRLTRQLRRYAAVDRRIRPQTFRRPDLGSPAIRRAAVRAGVDLTDRADVDAADRRYAARQARTWR
jgi:lysophospholipase L1-like esterase